MPNGPRKYLRPPPPSSSRSPAESANLSRSKPRSTTGWKRSSPPSLLPPLKIAPLRRTLYGSSWADWAAQCFILANLPSICPTRSSFPFPNSTASAGTLSPASPPLHQRATIPWNLCLLPEPLYPASLPPSPPNGHFDILQKVEMSPWMQNFPSFAATPRRRRPSSRNHPICSISILRICGDSPPPSRSSAKSPRSRSFSPLPESRRPVKPDFFA